MLINCLEFWINCEYTQRYTCHAMPCGSAIVQKMKIINNNKKRQQKQTIVVAQSFKRFYMLLCLACTSNRAAMSSAGPVRRMRHSLVSCYCLLLLSAYVFPLHVLIGVHYKIYCSAPCGYSSRFDTTTTNIFLPNAGRLGMRVVEQHSVHSTSNTPPTEMKEKKKKKQKL